MKRWQTVMLAGALALALVVVNGLVLARERLLQTGQVVLLQLAPVDPRSLMQGDYMALDYAIAREIRQADNSDEPDQRNEDGYLILVLDANGVARHVRTQPEATPRETGEVALRFRHRGWRVVIASNAWFFPEGQAERYEKARYGELRVSERGEALLAGLRDEAFKPL